MLKIGLLNPWTDAAENQLVPFIVRAAEQAGHTVVECKNSGDVLRHSPDFVLAMSRTQPKLVDVPTYGILFDPRTILLDHPSYLTNFFTYDGVLTIFDSLRDFATDLLAAARRDTPIGSFYPTCLAPEWHQPIELASVRLAYFGVNWDGRRNGLFTRLDQQPWMEIYGPRSGWTFLTGHAYKGTVPFDGISVIERYRAAGAALCLFSERHMADDIITSRVFEASAAGAVIIAPRMRWLEATFGDSILYIDQHAPDDELVEQITRHITWIRSHPVEAGALSEAAHEIFTERFSLDRLLANAIEYHHSVQRAREGLAAAITSRPLVSVVVLVRDASTRQLTRSLDSIARQRYAQVEVLITQPVDIPDAARTEAIAGFERTAGRPATIVPCDADTDPLAAALQAGAGDFIAVLMAGDEWQSDHLTSLMSALQQFGDRKLGHSGSVFQHRRAFTTEGGSQEVREVRPFPFSYATDDVVGAGRDLPLSTLLFHRELLDAWALRDPHLSTDAGARLILALLERETPVFSYKATCLQHEADRSAPGQPAGTDSLDDAARAHLRFVGHQFPPHGRLVTFDAVRQAIRRARPAFGEATAVSRPEGTLEYALPAALLESMSPEESWLRVPLPLALDDLELGERSGPARPGRVYPLAIRPPRTPGAEGLYWPLRLAEDRPYVLHLHCRVEGGRAGFGVLTRQRGTPAYQVVVPARPETVVVSLPISRPSEIGGIVVTATADRRPVQVVIEEARLFAAEAALPRVVSDRVLDENERLRRRLDTAAGVRETLEEDLERSRQRVREIKSSRVWQASIRYWEARGWLRGVLLGKLPRRPGTDGPRASGRT